MLDFRVPEHDKVKPGRQIATLAHQIAALPLLIEVCEEIAREPYPDSDPASLLETLRQRAKLALAKAAGETTEPTNP